MKVTKDNFCASPARYLAEAAAGKQVLVEDAKGRTQAIIGTNGKRLFDDPEPLPTDAGVAPASSKSDRKSGDNPWLR